MLGSQNLPPSLPPNHERPDEIRPPVIDNDGTRRFYDVEFGRVMGFRPLRMDVFVPRSAEPVPVVVWIHGGAFKFGSRHDHHVGGPIWSDLLLHGFAVALIEYRLSAEAVFPACLHDCRASVRWLRAFGRELGIDPHRIGAWGESAGGHLAAFMGLNNPELELVGEVGVGGVSSDVQAAVAWYPPTDFLHLDEQALPDSALSHNDANAPESELIGGALLENPEKSIFASPISHVSAEAAPLLLIHGMLDREVPYQQSVGLHDALVAAGADVEIELVPDAGHVFDGVDSAPFIGQSVRFLRKHLS